MPIDPRFDWHPEPELIAITDEPVSRPALERLGAGAWGTALDYLYDEALRRAMGEPASYEALRHTFFGESGGPAPAPSEPTPSAELLAEFTGRLAPHQLNAWHPRSLSYFTPPPLWMSIVGELLAQVTQQGVDVWHAGPSSAFVEEEVVRWLCDLVGYGPGGFGVLTSGGVMANFMALALARDVHLTRLLEAPGPPRGRALEGVRVYASDQAHFSIARALDELGFAGHRRSCRVDEYRVGRPHLGAGGPCRTRGALASRRCGLRGGSSPVGQGCASHARSRSGGFGDGRSAQVVLSGI